jgi:hypothetical protein
MMDIFLRLTLDADIETVWDALARPAQMQAAASPFIRVRSREKSGFPAKWIPNTPHLVELSLFGLIPIGTQVVEPRFEERPGGVRMVIDSGMPASGPLTSLTEWEHRMAVSVINDNQTLYRDRLRIRGGWLTVPFGIGLWFMWQLRGRSLVRSMRRISRARR